MSKLSPLQYDQVRKQEAKALGVRPVTLDAVVKDARKGGLVREVLLSKDLAARLEVTRLVKPRQVVDRGVNYIQYYDLAGGRAWSQSFSAASQRELGFSNGAHGLRHSYAQERMAEFQQSGMNHDDAKATVAQEVGHFDKETTEAYLR